jgi:hypothetical protein
MCRADIVPCVCSWRAARDTNGEWTRCGGVQQDERVGEVTEVAVLVHVANLNGCDRALAAAAEARIHVGVAQAALAEAELFEGSRSNQNNPAPVRKL